MIWFTSDTHFGHENILKYCNRPYKTIEEMNEGLISNWNEVVKKDDTIYHLGDFAMMRNPDLILRRLNGFKHLILGNHDKKNRKTYRNSPYLVSVHDVLELRFKDVTLWLSHYAHARWPHAHHGSLHLFGHSHGGFKGLGRSMDVGVDPMDYYPISIDEVTRILSKIEPVEHHGED
jgi:calcineurin-like phosphoesterase family protein